MTSINILAYAKINWSLDIIGQAANGYHLVEMVMQTISLHDTISLEIATQTSLTSNQNVPLDQSNLALKAWQLLKHKFNLQENLKIHLEKNIPLAAGLAGGSTNAAAVLTGVNQLFNLGISAEHLRADSLILGADTPFCLLGGTALAEGIGEKLTPLPTIPQQYLILVNPNFPVSTQWVYQNFQQQNVTARPQTQALLSALTDGNRENIYSHCANVLESVTISAYPQLADIKNSMMQLGLLPLMSGSGPTIWGLAANQQQQEEAYHILKKQYPIVIKTTTI